MSVLLANIFFGAAILLVCIAALYFSLWEKSIKVGILHSKTGTMAESEGPVIDAILMAIDEINRAEGLLGRKIKPIVIDGRSEGVHFCEAAKKLIVQHKVCVIFGCWTSDSRKSVKPIVEEYNHLLIYPLQYEGIEQSKNIIYTGMTPNQQIVPTIKWAYDNLGKRFFLVGSDYVFPHTANAIIKDQVKALGGEVVGEEYFLLGATDVADVAGHILDAKPDVIINTINGTTNISFFKSLRSHGIVPSIIPTISFSLAEDELSHFQISDIEGDYAAWSYFESIPSEINQRFIKGYQQRYGDNRLTDDPIESGYLGVHLWAQAVEAAGTENVTQVIELMKGMIYRAPEGMVHIDPDNQHSWKILRIGKIRGDGQFDIVWNSIDPIPPIPYPAYRTKEEWERFLDDLYVKWGNKWANH